MTLSVINRPATDENIERAGWNSYRGYFLVTLAEPRRHARRHVRLYRDRDGKPYVRDRLYGRRYVTAVRFLTVDGEPLNCGAVVLQKICECGKLACPGAFDCLDCAVETVEAIDAGEY